MADESPLGPASRALACSVGIMAYNEAANIATAMETILHQRLTVGHVAELIVVASGCTDATVPIVTAIARHDARVRLLVQERREGKASAINLFLGAARSPLLLMVGADVLVKDGTLDALLHHFGDPSVGMVGGHPLPVNDEGTFLGHTIHLLWRLHDHVARDAPKLGEVVAWRNVVPHIPLDTAVDEISIQALITQLGYRLVYEPRAIVYNRGPATVRDFLHQRRRIYAGHLRIRQQQGYAASTMSAARVGRALLALHPFTAPHAACWTLCAVGLEAVARGLGHYDHRRNRSHHVWEMVASTKPRIAAATQSRQSVLAFRIVEVRPTELEMSTHAVALVTQQITHHMRRALGSDALVAIQPSGTIIALLPVDREEAEQTAQQLIQAIETTPLRVGGHHDGVAVKLACGIIAFSQTQALALAVPAAV
jgi:biofilm PGA synthesis N-glycosyltransferase PgaC